MSNEERGSQLFSEAIRSLEDGDNARAEQLLIGALNNLDKKHHLAILSLKSLVTISSNKSDFDAAIDWSLKLLESQTGALGHTHADVSRTVMNIATMCETLGKPEIANQVKELHQYASAAERAQKARQVKNIRTTAKSAQTEEEPTEDQFDEKAATLPEYLARQSQNWRGSLTQMNGLTVSIIFLVALGLVCGSLVALKFCYSDEHNRNFSQPRPRMDGTTGPLRYTSADNRVEAQFVLPTKVEIDIDTKKRTFPYNCYGYDITEIGDLMIRSPLEKEYWLMRNPDGLVDEAGRAYLHERLADRQLLSHILNVADMAERFYKKNKRYPDNVREIGDFSYDNPYTLRRDNPLIQIVTVPGHRSPQAFLTGLSKGELWPGEATLYPGCINIAHVSHRTNMSVPETLVIHGCNGWSRFFTQSTGQPYYLVFERGARIEPHSPKLTFLNDISRVCVLDISPAFANLALLLIKARFVLLFGLLFIASYAVAGLFSTDATKKVAFWFGTVYLVIALACAYLAWFY
ncbi:MAG: hypothetical protein SGJ27_15120 [Candidatus Melainabacteria bacterium]|nr:hypothetical protein [Candidatus Melainabacteria bacterium]